MKTNYKPTTKSEQGENHTFFYDYDELIISSINILENA